MNPASIAKESESSHQIALFAWCSQNVKKYPELEWFHAIPNGGSRGDNPQARAIRGAKLIAEGVRPGVSDTFLPVKRGMYSGLYIEMKKPSVKPKKKTSKGGVSKEQLDFGNFVQLQGFGFVVCYSWEDAVNVLIEYLNYK